MSKIVWRISKKKHEKTAFSGEGAKLGGGRWNSPGNSVVYTSENLSLATLETFVHLGIEEIGILFVVIRVEIPDNVLIETVSAKKLPFNWQDDPAPKTLATIGDEWLISQKTSVLIVPSAVTPVENNYLLNPLHQDFSKIIIQPAEPFIFDQRMWKTTN